MIRRKAAAASVILLGAVLTSAGWAAELGRFEIKEPLGEDWPGEWITREVAVDTGGARVRVGRLGVLASFEGESGVEAEGIPAQFYRNGKLLGSGDYLQGAERLKVFCRVRLKKDRVLVARITDELPPGGTVPKVNSGWTEELYAGWPGRPDKRGMWGRNWWDVRTDYYMMRFEDRSSRVFDDLLVLPRGDVSRASWGGVYVKGPTWPENIFPTDRKMVIIEQGPARTLVKRVFEFEDSSRTYEITFDFRAGDPWIGVHEKYDLGPGSFMRLDLSGLGADVVYHPHTYSARTFKADGQAEDSTIQPPQHPVAALGPIWRDIWFGGGSHAFVYNSDATVGVGFAAVKGSQWKVKEGVSLVSQNLSIHGDKNEPGKVWLKLPTDGGERHWAIIAGGVELRKEIGAMIRAHADIPLEAVLDGWVLDWDSDHQAHSFGMAGAWFGPFNRHQLNPTTFPRRVRSHLGGLLEKGTKVKSRDLAFLAYVFTDPNYWPGPEYRWGNVGNPNFHTDMYNVPLQIGLVMPDHPDAERWVDYGVRELHANVVRDSFPGGAWAESLSYSAFFFHIVDYATRIRDAGVADPFRQWPRIKEVAMYLACMHGPVDPRYGVRQRAPIGDTHPGNYMKELREMGRLYRGIDDGFAGKLERFGEKWEGAMDIGSREFYGFGAMLRGGAYDERRESFVTVKAGPARNHYQGDELSFYFCSLGTPLAIDYACHYSPRPWSASMHNRPDMDSLRPVAVGIRRAFERSDSADVFVADERARRISHVPMEPHNTTKPGREYPTSYLSEEDCWTMRRYVMLVKHEARSRLADYLVVRDEIASPKKVWWNLHMLARDVRQRGQIFTFGGQLDVDVDVHFLGAAVDEVQKRQWGWSRERNRGSLRNYKGEQYEREHFGHYIPEDFERGTWGRSFEHSGEAGKWLRVGGSEGGSEWFVVIMPYLRGEEAPKVERLSDTSARITLGAESEVVYLGSEGEHQAGVERGGKKSVLLEAGQVKGWSELSFEPTPPKSRRGAM
jgi:hypothetical protein